MKQLMKGMDASERAVAEIYNAKTGIFWFCRLIGRPYICCRSCGRFSTFLDRDRARYMPEPLDVVAYATNAAQAQASADAVTAERKRLADIDSIAASIPDPQLVHDAKYGDNPCTAQELCFRVMQQSAFSRASRPVSHVSFVIMPRRVSTAIPVLAL